MPELNTKCYCELIPRKERKELLENKTYCSHFKLDSKAILIHERLTGHATIMAIDHNGKTFAAISFCSPKDHFSKKLGRRFALQKLSKGLHTIIPTDWSEERQVVGLQNFFEFTNLEGNKTHRLVFILNSVLSGKIPASGVVKVPSWVKFY